MRFLAVAVTICVLADAPTASAAPVLRAADVTVVMSANTCAVTMGLTIEGADEIDHRIDSDAVDLIDVVGAERIGDIHVIGRTRSLRLRSSGAASRRPPETAYQIRYHAVLVKGREYRCPLWLPTIPTDGQSRAVAIHVEIPWGAMPPAESMPAFTWNERRGEATLGHLPVFVHVPFTADGASVPWSVGGTMDALTIVIIVAASTIWVWRRKR